MALSTAVKTNTFLFDPNFPLFHRRLRGRRSPPPFLRLPPPRRPSGPVASLRAGAHLFFARLPDRPPPLEHFAAPLAAVVAGAARWLEIFRDVLVVRVLLAWFPNIPWDRQPFSAIRDLSDPYLSLFRNVVPPIGNVDISILPALAILSTLISILSNRPVSMQ